MLGHRHRIDHDRRGDAGAACSDTVSTIVDDASIPVLTACTPISPSTELELRGDRLGGQLPVPLDTHRVLRRHCADNGHAVHAEGEHGLQVGLDPGAACRV